MITFRKQRRAKTKDDFETWINDEIANTLNTFDGGGTRATTVVVDDKDTDSAERSGGGGQ